MTFSKQLLQYLQKENLKIFGERHLWMASYCFKKECQRAQLCNTVILWHSHFPNKYLYENISKRLHYMLSKDKIFNHLIFSSKYFLVILFNQLLISINFVNVAPCFKFMNHIMQVSALQKELLQERSHTGAPTHKVI